MQPGIVMRKKDAHARMGMIPAHNSFTFEAFFDLVMEVHKAVLGERQIDTPLKRMASR